MKTTLEDLKNRRSCRSYKPEQITDAELDAVLEAGTFAPTAKGSQCPIIIAVQNPDLVKKLSQMNAAVMGSDRDPFYGAPTVLVVLADRAMANRVYDGSLVMGNLMLAAHELGLGSCWIHRAKEEFESEEGTALLKSLGVEEEYEGVGHCALGYVAGEYPAAPKRKENWVYYIK